MAEMSCPRCKWEGDWQDLVSVNCADGCCTMFLCPKCEFEGVENHPEEYKEDEDETEEN